MSKQQINHIIRAWKDQDYRESLSEQERAQLPENPAGIIKLEDNFLQNLVGGAPSRGNGCFTNPLICG